MCTVSREASMPASALLGRHFAFLAGRIRCARVQAVKWSDFSFTPSGHVHGAGAVAASCATE
ncbi:hypothetical protein RALTA_A1029 [Cupriavidus taiwanensis LMG 19424]|uniref:Uncharacterized protein n=1 Tax=Cupriavidus taiwanensis (strain DSM 17343 / BCRC 17206 / CCUG 44338 / CIP 107171 / LMG 19424 / R1) TaxID=977880 RepID=B3R3W2_CUPTR|nr:hypothetical protein RALTA_A1029 [Cupriavidus taiwanensis LMG 19424]